MICRIAGRICLVLGKFFHSSFQNELNPESNVTLGNTGFALSFPLFFLVFAMFAVVFPISLDNTRVALGTVLAVYVSSQ